MPIFSFNKSFCQPQTKQFLIFFCVVPNPQALQAFRGSQGTNLRALIFKLCLSIIFSVTFLPSKFLCYFLPTKFYPGPKLSGSKTFQNLQKLFCQAIFDFFLCWCPSPSGIPRFQGTTPFGGEIFSLWGLPFRYLCPKETILPIQVNFLTRPTFLGSPSFNKLFC